MGYATKNYESFGFGGGYSSLSPDYGNFVGYRLNAGQISSPTGVQTANQLNEVIARIKEGVKNVELQPLQQGVFDQIPAQHFAEMKALMKLSGVKPSVHAEIVDPAGFGERGYEGDLARQDAERRLFSIVEKSQQLDPDGNIPIVIHSSAGIPGPEYRPGDESKGEKRFQIKKMAFINQETKELKGAEEEYKYYIGTPEEELKGKGILHKPENDAHVYNNSDWDNKISNLVYYKKNADDMMANAPAMLADYAGKPIPRTEEEAKKFFATFEPAQLATYGRLQQSEIFLDNVRLNLNSAFNTAFKYGTPEQKEELIKISNKYAEQMSELPPTVLRPVDMSKVLSGAISALHNLTNGREEDNRGVPQIYKPVEEFAMDKAAKTFGNVALKSYEKFKNNAPILAIENMYQGFAFSRAEDMKKLVEESRKVFVDTASRSKNEGGLGISKGEAQKQADKMIGVNWDVGHLNMMRKAGFNEKDVVKETETIAKLVKHVHLTDNFGYSDSHLPPGMGNVPFKGILEKLEKAGALKNAKMVVEAGAFVQHFKKSPHPYTLQAFGSPIYGGKMAPYWNQTSDTWGSYFGFPLAYMPEKHFSLYGGGFSMLPEELGGQMPGTQSRFSGTSNA